VLEAIHRVRQAVLRNLGAVINPDLHVRQKRLGRKRVYADGAAKMRAYRERKSWRPFTEINATRKVTDIQKVDKKWPVSA
jgi:hypothetical protein